MSYNNVAGHGNVVSLDLSPYSHASIRTCKTKPCRDFAYPFQYALCAPCYVTIATRLELMKLMRCDVLVHKETSHVTIFARAQLTKLKRGVTKGLVQPRRHVTARATDTQHRRETYTLNALDTAKLNEVFSPEVYDATPCHLNSKIQLTNHGPIVCCFMQISNEALMCMLANNTHIAEQLEVQMRELKCQLVEEGQQQGVQYMSVLQASKKLYRHMR